MTHLIFDYRWAKEVARSASPELQATWAVLSIRADSDSLLVAIDRETSDQRDWIVVPLYPIAEWIASSWWLLFENPRALSKKPRDHRSLRSCGDGFLWPDLSFKSLGDAIEIRASSTSAGENEYISFRAHDPVWVDSGEVRLRFTELVEAVLRRLAEAGVTNTPLHEIGRAHV